jgi:hypothetical protein
MKEAYYKATTRSSSFTFVFFSIIMTLLCCSILIWCVKGSDIEKQNSAENGDMEGGASDDVYQRI